MRNWILIAALAVAGLAGSEARANPPFPCRGPFCNQPYAVANGYASPYHPFFGGSAEGLHGPVLPVFQAAPWYLYFPYDGHFQTPAPVYGYGGNGPGFGYGFGYGHGGYPFFPAVHNPYPMSMTPAK